MTIRPATFEIAPLRALRFGADESGKPLDLTSVAAPPYDVISPQDHQALLDRSPYSIVRLTLGDRPGERAPYRERAELLEAWRSRKALREETGAALHVYGVDYAVPGQPHRRRRFRGLLALGSLHDFEEKVVQPHERTFSDVVDDRYRLLEATRTHLELILLLYSEPERRIDAVLEEASRGRPEAEVEARPGETHALWPIRSGAALEDLRGRFRSQRPIIADGHHRYTTACLYRRRSSPARKAGEGWQPMVLGNLYGEGLSILATHRLVDLGGRAEEGLRILEEKLEPAGERGRADLEVETRGPVRRFAIPSALRASRRGAAATDYAILHEVILGEWLRPLLAARRAGEGPPGEGPAAEGVASGRVRYFKEGTGEGEALRRGEGDLLFRMRPVEREEFQKVVEGGEVFPHKTTFFYPKLWSGLVLWTMAEPDPLSG